MPPRKLRFFLALSLVFHAALLRKKHSTPDRQPRQIEVEVAKVPYSAQGRGNGGRNGNLKLNDLLLQERDYSVPSSPSPVTRQGSGPLSNATPLDGATDDPTYLHIHEKIRNHLLFPTEFKVAKIEGTVRAIIEFSEDGRFMKGRSEFKSLSPYLRIFVLRAVRAAFATPLAPHRRLPARYRRVECVFEFAVAMENETEWANERPFIYARKLFFYEKHIRPKVVSFNPTTPNGIQLNVLELLERVHDALTPDTGVDMLEKYRHDPDWEN